MTQPIQECHINGTPVDIDNKNLMTVTNRLKDFCYKYSSYHNMLDLVDGLNHIKAELDYFWKINPVRNNLM